MPNRFGHYADVWIESVERIGRTIPLAEAKHRTYRESPLVARMNAFAVSICQVGQDFNCGTGWGDYCLVRVWQAAKFGSWSQGKGGRLDLIDPSKEQFKATLAAALMARHPTLRLYRRDYSRIAKARGIDEAEARRDFRTVELNDKKLGIPILLFDVLNSRYEFIIFLR
jgi:Spy/CpxP family protein refolding chaperone